MTKTCTVYLTLHINLWFSLSCTEPCLVELTDTSDGGVGNIADEMVKQGLVTATFTEHVCLYGNAYGFLMS